MKPDVIYHTFLNPHKTLKRYGNSTPNRILQGLKILVKYFDEDRELIPTIKNHQLESVTINELSEAGITMEDVEELYQLGWEVRHRGQNKWELGEESFLAFPFRDYPGWILENKWYGETVSAVELTEGDV